MVTKLHEESENADRSRELLRGWVVQSPLPPRFQEQVWQRIARAEARPEFAPWDALLGWLQSALGRPRIAFSYVAVLLVLGVAAGSWMAQLESSRVDAALGKRYVQAVDPYQASALNQ